MLAADDSGAIGLVHALVLGFVEGLTEFLPVSSTGHLIAANAILGHSDPTLEVAIQTGAITAILVLYWRPLWRSLRTVARPVEKGRTNLLWLIAVTALPAAVFGLALEERIDELLFNPSTVAVALIVGGLALLGLERWLERREAAGEPLRVDLETLGLRGALVVGFFQCLSLVPGTSRAAATIAGGLVLGMRRTAAAQLSFLVGLPVLYGAALLKVGKDPGILDAERLPTLLVATAASFVTALAVVRPFVRFLQRHTFRPFAWYRIVAGAALGVAVAAGAF